MDFGGTKWVLRKAKMKFGSPKMNFEASIEAAGSPKMNFGKAKPLQICRNQQQA